VIVVDDGFFRRSGTQIGSSEQNTTVEAISIAAVDPKDFCLDRYV
jgi:hypothetical protein